MFNLSTEKKLYFYASGIHDKWLEEAKNVNWNIFYNNEIIQISIPTKIAKKTDRGVEFLPANTDNFSFLDYVFSKAKNITIEGDIMICDIEPNKKNTELLKTLEGEFDISGEPYSFNNYKDTINSNIKNLQEMLEATKNSVKHLENEIRQQEQGLELTAQREEKIKKCLSKCSHFL